MEPVERIVAVLQGGPLDGLRFSVALDQDAHPPEVHDYRPEKELNLKPGSDAYLAVVDGFDLHEDVGLHGHRFVGFWTYVPIPVVNG